MKPILLYFNSLLIPFSFLPILLSLNSPCAGQSLIPFLEGNKYGFANDPGMLIIPARYSKVNFMNRFGFASVERDSLSLLVTKKAHEIFLTQPAGYTGYQGISKSGQVTYGKKNTIDTLYHLIRLEYYQTGQRCYLNTNTGIVSPMFKTRFGDSHQSVGMLTGFEGSLTHGIYIGQTNPDKFQIMKSDAEIIASSRNRPKILNDSLVTYSITDKAVVLNFLTLKSDTFSWPKITDITENGDYITSAIFFDENETWRTPEAKLIMGVITTLGEITIPFMYSHLEEFGPNRLLARLEKQYFLIDYQGRRMDTMIYQKVYKGYAGSWQAQRTESKWILLDSTGVDVLGRNFDVIHERPNDRGYYAQKGDSAFIVSHKLNIEAKHKAEVIYASERPGFYHFTINNKNGLLKAPDKVIIPAIYDDIKVYPWSNFLQVELDDLYGIMDVSGNILLPPVYQHIEIMNRYGREFICVKLKDQYQWLDSELNALTKFEPQCPTLYSSALYYQKSKKDFFTFYTRYGDTARIQASALAITFDQPDSTYLLFLSKGEESFLVFEDDGHILVDTIPTSEAASFGLGTGLSVVTEGLLEGVQHFTGHWVISPANHEVISITPFLLVLKIGTKYFFYDHQGKLLRKRKASSIHVEEHSAVWEFEKNKKIGYVSAYSGKCVIPPRYNEGFVHNPTCIEVSTWSKDSILRTFIYDYKGNKLLKTEFLDVYPLDYNEITYYYTIGHFGKKGLMDREGNICLPPVYKTIYDMVDTTFYVAITNNNNELIFNRNWELVFTDHPTSGYQDYIELPHHRYILKYKEYSLIVDSYGNVLDRINTNGVEHITFEYPKRHMIVVREQESVYYINPNSLVKYIK